MSVMAANSENISLHRVSRDNGDEHSLVAAFKNGDGSAFDRLVATHYGEVRQLVHRLSGWDGDTEDVVQDVFLAAFLGLKKFDGRSSLRTWLFAIAMNKCRHRRYRRWFHLARVDKAAAEIVACDNTVGRDEQLEQVQQVSIARWWCCGTFMASKRRRFVEFWKCPAMSFS
ncbi:MAG: RNA polymerase sigma factor [Phycisphaerae bacterium]|nr:RNA polymerase sigma factor [Phycisphaerae bacterium]